MMTEDRYQAAVDDKCYELRLVQKDMATADLPDASNFAFGDDEWGKNELVSELYELAEVWVQGAEKIGAIEAELKEINAAYGPDKDLILVDRLDVAVNTAIATQAKIKGVAKNVSELVTDDLSEWANNAQDMIEELAFPVTPIRIYDWRGMPRYCHLADLYPFDQISDEQGAVKRLLRSPLLRTPVTGSAALVFQATRKVHAKYIRPNAKLIESVLHWILLGAAVVLFPYHAGYSFGVLVACIVATCWSSGRWYDFIPTVASWAVVYGLLLAWLLPR